MFDNQFYNRFIETVVSLNEQLAISNLTTYIVCLFYSTKYSADIVINFTKLKAWKVFICRDKVLDEILVKN